jgi:hypothetical protein
MSQLDPDRLVVLHHLGARRSVHTYKYSWLEDLGGSFSGILFGTGFGIGAFFVFRTDEIWRIIFGGLLALIGLVLILMVMVVVGGWFSRIGRQEDVHLYDHGLMYHKGKSYEAIRWDQMDEIWRGSNRTETGPFVDAIRRLDGRRFNFSIDGKLDHLRDLSQTIEKESAPYLLPQAQAAFKAGQQVVLGKMSLDPLGISVENKTITWSELESIRVDSSSGQIVLQKQGEAQPWAELYFWDIPNILILEAVLNSEFAGQVFFRFGMYIFHKTLFRGLSPEVQQLIDNHQLGNPMKIYKPMEILGQYRDPYAIFCADGVAFVSRDSATAFRWDQIMVVWQKVKRKSHTSHSTVRKTNPTTGKVSYESVSTTHYYYLYSFAIQKANDAQLEFDSGQTHTEELAKNIAQEVAPYLLPQAQATFSAGCPVVFGEMSLDLSGVSVSGKMVAWDELESIEVNEHYGDIVFLKQKKFWAWATLSFSNIPNIMVFEALVNSKLTLKVSSRGKRIYGPPTNHSVMRRMIVAFGMYVWRRL